MIKYMLDTNILIYTIRNRPKKVRDASKKHADYLTMSTVTLGELIYGAEKSAQSVRNLADVEKRTRSSGRNIQTICQPIACPGKTHVVLRFLMNKQENRVAPRAETAG